MTSLTRSAILSAAASAAGPRAAPLPDGAVGDPQHDDPVALPEPDIDAGLLQRPADVGLQHPLELVPVAALEHDLAELEQDARLTEGPSGRAGVPGLLAVLGYRGRGHSPSLPATYGDATRPGQRISRSRGATLLS